MACTKEDYYTNLNKKEGDPVASDFSNMLLSNMMEYIESIDNKEVRYDFYCALLCNIFWLDSAGHVTYSQSDPSIWAHDCNNIMQVSVSSKSGPKSDWLKVTYDQH